MKNLCLFLSRLVMYMSPFYFLKNKNAPVSWVEFPPDFTPISRLIFITFHFDRLCEKYNDLSCVFVSIQKSPASASLPLGKASQYGIHFLVYLNSANFANPIVNHEFYQSDMRYCGVLRY